MTGRGSGPDPAARLVGKQPPFVHHSYLAIAAPVWCVCGWFISSIVSSCRVLCVSCVGAACGVAYASLLLDRSTTHRHQSKQSNCIECVPSIRTGAYRIERCGRERVNQSQVLIKLVRCDVGCEASCVGESVSAREEKARPKVFGKTPSLDFCPPCLPALAWIGLMDWAAAAPHACKAALHCGGSCVDGWHVFLVAVVLLCVVSVVDHPTHKQESCAAMLR